MSSNFVKYWFATTVILFYYRAANGVVYHGLSYNTNELAGNPFVNFALYGFVEIPASIFAIFTLEKLGKKNLIGGSMVIGGMACFVSYFLPSGKYASKLHFSLFLCITMYY